MFVVRKYRKLDWWDFLTVIDQELLKTPEQLVYFDILDELRMRKVDSISEGATFKLKAPANRLLLEFENRMSVNDSFASEKDFQNLRKLCEFLL